MNTNAKRLLTVLLFALLFVPGTYVFAQTDDELEVEDGSATSDDDTAAAYSPVCRYAHWLSPASRYCLNQHIDGFRGVWPPVPCNYIQVGGIWYHIVAVRRVPGRLILTVRPVPPPPPVSDTPGTGTSN